MCNDSQQRLIFSTCIAGRAKGRAESSFVLRDGSLNVPAVAIDATMKSSAHLASVASSRPFAGITFVEGNDRRADTQFAPGQKMIVFAIVTGVGQQTIDRQVPDGLSDRL